MGLLRQTGLLLWKDLLLELRRRESLIAMFFFGILLLFVFHFAFEVESNRAAELAPGLLWLAAIFTGTLGLAQLFDADKESRCLEALLLAPTDRGAIYLAKVAYALLLMSLVEIVVFPLFALLFNLNLWAFLPSLFLIAFLGTLGFCVLGVLFSALTLKARARELLLPLILFPLMTPVILAVVRGMEALFRTGTLDEAGLWLRLLVGFDVIFLTAGFLIFEQVIEA